MSVPPALFGSPSPLRLDPILTSSPSRNTYPHITGGRTQVAYPTDGEITLRVPAGTSRVIVSRGYEYELESRDVTVGEGETVDASFSLTRVVDTTGVLCGDFHIHTHRSNDSGDDAHQKVRSAAADGLEIPVRSDHEYVGSFQPIIEELGSTDWLYGVSSIEMTSFQTWGHMGVVPLTPLPDEVNAGAPRWQRYPSVADPSQPVVAMEPPEVFDTVRMRPEQPVIIINHPRGDPNYFDYVGYDPLTGDIARTDAWDERFTLVEVFNDSDWLHNRDRTVRDWLSLLSHGRRVFAVGSSDSHHIAGSPVGYPRTCLEVGTDDPSALTPDAVRDALAAGHATISGGIYVDATVGDAGPGDDASGVGPQATVHVRVQAASWIDVGHLDVVVDGETVQTIDILPEDADPLTPTIRFERDITVDVSSAESYAIFAAYGSAALEPVHPQRIPFGVTNPIFLRR